MALSPLRQLGRVDKLGGNKQGVANFRRGARVQRRRRPPLDAEFQVEDELLANGQAFAAKFAPRQIRVHTLILQI
jgi:hypothetical protein